MRQATLLELFKGLDHELSVHPCCHRVYRYAYSFSEQSTRFHLAQLEATVDGNCSPDSIRIALFSCMPSNVLTRTHIGENGEHCGFPDC